MRGERKARKMRNTKHYLPSGLVDGMQKEHILQWNTESLELPLPLREGEEHTPVRNVINTYHTWNMFFSY